MKTKIILLMILIILFTVFVSQNTAIIPINVFLWQFSLSTIVLISIAFFIGMLAGFLISMIFKVREKGDSTSPGE